MLAKKPSEMSLEELKKAEKSLNIAVWLLIICVVMMAIASVIRLVNKEYGFKTFLPVFFAPLVVINRKNLKSIRDEIAQRETSRS
jgi:hypothetical protein